MNLGINKDEAIIIQWALEEFIEAKGIDNIKKFFIDADIVNIFKQLDLIILLEE